MIVFEFISVWIVFTFHHLHWNSKYTNKNKYKLKAPIQRKYNDSKLYD